MCGGFAAFTGINPLVIRLIWLISIFWNGFGLWMYLFALFIIPAQTEEITAGYINPAGKRVFGIILIVVGLVTFFKEQIWTLFDYMPGPAQWLPFALIAAGLAMIFASILRPRKIADPELRTNSEHSEEDAFEREQRVEIISGINRSRSERVIFGICGGIGIRLGIDPVIVRVIWFVATIVTHGLALVVYLLFYFLMPEEADDRRPATDTPQEPLETNGSPVNG